MASVDLSSITDTFISSHFSINEEAGTTATSNSATTTQHIYGRSNETTALFNAYQRLLHTKQAQTVIVHGESGSGKTALVDLLRDHMGNRSNNDADNKNINNSINNNTGTHTTAPTTTSTANGYFVAGKYFQHFGGVQEPHSAITAAFSDLCDLVAQSDAFHKYRQEQIKDILSSDAQVLLKSISNLAPFVLLEDDQELFDTTPCEGGSVGKFKVACKTFLRAMASDEYPVVIFLDDIQWADEGSRQLIEMFLQDSDLKNVMLILAYRDEEATQVVEDMIVHARDATAIQMSSLDVQSISDLISSNIAGGYCTSENLHDLSELVKKRTGGNPLFVNLFMEAIKREEMFIVDSISGMCTFDVEDIQIEIMASETMAELLARKIGLLAGDIVETLKVAALLGYHFDKDILIKVAGTIIEEGQFMSSKSASGVSATQCHPSVVESLLAASKAGFVEATRDGYQFTHDKLQASVQSLISDREAEQMHLLIGTAFLNRPSEMTANIYNAAIHLNRAPGFLHNESQRNVLASINLQASKYCEMKSAFAPAVSLLKVGLDVLGPEDVRWSECTFDLTFEMMESLARTQLIVGDFEGCKMTTTEALKYGKTVEMKINLLMIDVEVRMFGIEVEDALTTAFRALRALGIDMPEKVKGRHVLGKLFKVRRLLRKTTDEELLNLPITEDRIVTNIVKVLMHICSYCLIKDEANPGVYSALLATELTLKAGLLSPHSSSALAIYGVAEVSFGNYARAYKYGQIALAMAERMSNKEGVCLTAGYVISMLTFWRESYAEMINPLFLAAAPGFQRGDVMYATYCMSQSYHLHINAGSNLAVIEESMRIQYSMVADLSQDGMILWFQPALQYVLNLQKDISDFEAISILSGEFMNEKEYFGQLFRGGHPILIMIACVLKAEIACHFEQFSIAALIYKEVQCYAELLEVGYAAPVYFWNATRTYYGLYEETGKRLHLRKSRKYRKMLQKMVTIGVPAATPVLAYLIAEESARRKRISESDLHAVYSVGIKCLAECNLKHYEGMLNEKAGFNFARRGWYDAADEYFQRALHIYKYDWGGTAKYNWLEEKREEALAQMSHTSIAAIPNGITVPQR